jgi:hypothetical protein
MGNATREVFLVVPRTVLITSSMCQNTPRNGTAKKCRPSRLKILSKYAAPKRKCDVRAFVGLGGVTSVGPGVVDGGWCSYRI